MVQVAEEDNSFEAGVSIVATLVSTFRRLES
jgi:hypothetical protein